MRRTPAGGTARRCNRRRGAAMCNFPGARLTRAASFLRVSGPYGRVGPPGSKTATWRRCVGSTRCPDPARAAG